MNKKSVKIPPIYLLIISLILTITVLEMICRHFQLSFSAGTRTLLTEIESRVSLDDTEKAMAEFRSIRNLEIFDSELGWSYMRKNTYGNPNARLIAMVGDSFTAGDGLTENETFPAILGSTSDDAFRVQNYATSGFGICQMYIRIRRNIISQHPYHIFVCIIGDDLQRMFTPTPGIGELPYPVWGKPYVVKTSNGFTIKNRSIVTPTAGLTQLLQLNEQPRFALWNTLKFILHRVRVRLAQDGARKGSKEALEGLTFIVSNIQDLCRNNDIGLTFVYFPMQSELKNIQEKENWRWLRNYLLHLSEEMNFGFVDLSQVFEDYKQKNIHTWETDLFQKGHPTSQSNEISANAINSYIKSSFKSMPMDGSMKKTRSTKAYPSSPKTAKAPTNSPPSANAVSVPSILVTPTHPSK